MGSLSIWHWLVLGAVVLIFFGRGKISDVMGDVAKGVKSFKRGLADDETPVSTTTAMQIPVDLQQPTVTVASPVDDRRVAR